MKKPTNVFLPVIAILLSQLSLAQPANDNCANAISLSTAITCTTGLNSLTSQTLSGATGDGGTITTTCTAVASQDVWYKFVAQCAKPTITISNKGTSWGTTMKIQLLSGSCGSFTEVACANNPTTLTPAGNLTLGNVYYIRIHKNTLTAPSGTNWGFDICLTGPQETRMNEVFSQTIISNNVINTPWEVTYGPDGFLWVTGSHDYRAYRIDPATLTKTTILDLSNATPDFPALKVQFNNTANVAGCSCWPQGGFAGLAIHPQFNTNHWVYVSYVLKYDSMSSSANVGPYFRNSIVRFTYNTVSGKLESPSVVCDTLPGGQDHNSQRLIVAPVGGTNYLFYGQGEMGAGQLGFYMRPNHAQDSNYYEGKILRFNCDPDPSEGAYDQWIPNDNPYNHAKQSAIWDIGIRNNQGFAYNSSTGVLYASSHGPYSDDEINIIERYKNYGHPLVEGFAADGNYNGTTTPGLSTSYSAGETFATNTGINSLAPIGDESANVTAINLSGHAPYKDPLFTAYAAGGAGYPAATKTVAAIWGAATKPGNGAWPSEAWSGMDVYTHTLIPGWKNSLLVCGLKWGRVLRLKMDPTGTSIQTTNGADTIALFQGRNRFRDLAISANGRDFFISNEGTSASGPAGVSVPAAIPNCTNCIVKYSFLGYADANGRSTLPDSIDVASGTLNSLNSGTTVTIDATNNYLWVPITGPDGNIMAEIKANGNNLGTVTSSFYQKSGAIRTAGGVHYLNRNMTITPTTQPSSAVDIRLYISKAEFDALDADPLSGVSAITDLKILKNSDPAGSAIASNAAAITTTGLTRTPGNGTGYVLQGQITSFSSFYIASANITLPLNLLSFKGSLQGGAALLDWETSNELNTSQFVIESSTDSHNFQQIGTVAATGTASTTNNYSYTDYDVARQSSSIVYYRLKMLDKDGAYTYSDVVTINLPLTAGKLLVSPNPTAGKLKVTLTTSADGKIKWNLTDNTGRTVLQNSTNLKKGMNSVEIDMSNLPGGIYYLSVSGGGIHQKVKLEKIQ